MIRKTPNYLRGMLLYFGCCRIMIMKFIRGSRLRAGMHFDWWGGKWDGKDGDYLLFIWGFQKLRYDDNAGPRGPAGTQKNKYSSINLGSEI